MIIPKGYQITITAREGEILGDIELEGYNLDKQIARGVLVDDIQKFVEDDILLNTNDSSL